MVDCTLKLTFDWCDIRLKCFILKCFEEHLCHIPPGVKLDYTHRHARDSLEGAVLTSGRANLSCPSEWQPLSHSVVDGSGDGSGEKVGLPRGPPLPQLIAIIGLRGGWARPEWLLSPSCSQEQQQRELWLGGMVEEEPGQGQHGPHQDLSWEAGGEKACLEGPPFPMPPSPPPPSSWHSKKSQALPLQLSVCEEKGLGSWVGRWFGFPAWP